MRLLPQLHTVPSAFTASVCDGPCAIATVPVRPVTATGDVWVVVVPLPICPDPFEPHPHIVPSLFNAWVVVPPAARAPVITKSARRTALGDAVPLHAFTFTTIDRSTVMPLPGTTGSLAVGSTPVVV